MALPVRKSALILCASSLVQDVFLDLRGVPSERRAEIRLKLEAVQHRMEKAAALMTEAAIYGVEE